MEPLKIKTYCVVERTQETACKYATERYMFDHGGIEEARMLIIKAGGSLNFRITDAVMIPGSQEFIFQVQIGIPHPEEEEVEEDDDYDFI